MSFRCNFYPLADSRTAKCPVLCHLFRYGWRSGAKFTKFIFIHIQAVIIIHEYIYSHSTTNFIFRKYINSHLKTIFLFTNIFTHIYAGIYGMHSFTPGICSTVTCIYPHSVIVWFNVQTKWLRSEINFVREMVQNSRKIYSFTNYCA